MVVDDQVRAATTILIFPSRISFSMAGIIISMAGIIREIYWFAFDISELSKALGGDHGINA